MFEEKFVDPHIIECGGRKHVPQQVQWLPPTMATESRGSTCLAVNFFDDRFSLSRDTFSICSRKRCAQMKLTDSDQDQRLSDTQSLA